MSPSHPAVDPAGADGAPRVLGLVADDLTGAADAAAGFAEQGWCVVLHLGRDLRDLAAPGAAAGEPVVLAVATRTRALPDARAAVATHAAVEALALAGAARLFVKIDSTVRGSVAGQVEGALSAWDAAHPHAAAVVCPAFPALGRTVEDGVVHVHGVPASATAAGADHVTPLAASALAALVPGGVPSTADDVARDLPSGARLLVDASTDADLDRLAARLAEAGPGVVAVGSGGLAAALGRRWGRAPSTPEVGTGGPVLVAVSSLHPVTAAQLAHLADRLAPPSLVLTTGADLTAHPDEAARALARQVADRLARRTYGALVLVGGDGAAAVLEHLGANALVVDGTVLGGCPTGVVRGGAADGLRVVTKSGGFGEPSALAAVVARLEAPRSPAPSTEPTREPASAGPPRPTLREETP